MAVALKNRHGDVELQLFVFGFDLALLVVGQFALMFRLQEQAESETAAHQVAHIRHGPFVGSHEDQVVLEFPDLSLRSLVFEDLCDVGRRLPKIGRHRGRFVTHHDEQRTAVAHFVRHFVGSGRGKHGIEFTARQAEKLADAFGQFGADFGSVDVPHDPADDHGEVRFHHEAQRGARAGHPDKWNR